MVNPVKSPVLPSTYDFDVASVVSTGVVVAVICPVVVYLTIIEEDAAVEVASRNVMYLFEADGELPARAAFSSDVGTLTSLSPTTIGAVEEAGAVEINAIPLTVVVISAPPAIAIPSA